MKQRVFMMVLVLAGLFLTAGCKSLFSHTESATVSRWKSYCDVESAFGKIIPDHTTVEDLRTLGFDPKVLPNVKILTYVDIMKTFMPNPAIRLQDLPDAVRACIEAQENSRAYLVELRDTSDKRHGNLFLDLFGFARRTHEAGWEFKGLILINDNLVVYKLSSGEPQVSREDSKIRPLGPFQELDSSVMRAVDLAK